jgi:hypothetical protein
MSQDNPVCSESENQLPASGGPVRRLVRLPSVALTIKQPWATLIVTGQKDLENRSWPTSFRGPVLIHASKRKDDDELHAFMDLAEARGIPRGKGNTTWGNCPSGGVIGMAEIVGCVDRSDSPWFVGDWGFLIVNARPLPFFACKGALGFWKCEYPQALLSETNAKDVAVGRERHAAEAGNSTPT